MHPIQFVIDSLFDENEGLPSFELQLAMENGQGWQGAPKKQTEAQREHGIIELIGVREIKANEGRTPGMVKLRMFVPIKAVAVALAIDDIKIQPASTIHTSGFGQRV